MRLLHLLVLSLLLIQSSPAFAPCCDPRAESDCCGPAGDCPTLPSGECALAAVTAHPAVPATPALLAAEPVATATTWLATPALAPRIAPASRTGAVPLHLTLHNL